MREIILDTETTGLDPKQGHKIVEIGCVEMINRSITSNNVHFYINPERESDEEALKVHGLDFDFLLQKPKFINIAKELISFLGDSKIVAHNANFDIGFLNHELDICGFSKNIIQEDRVTDTLVLARKKFPGTAVNLDALCKKFNIDVSLRSKHGALLDANLLSQVYIELLGGKQKEFNIDNEHNKQTNNSLTKREQKIFDRRDQILRLNDHDLKNHNNLLKTIKKPIWKNFLR
tara:strand:+ start:156 stop:854 length:699 start_codon:yes stop_codon:yes gene_type:complete